MKGIQLARARCWQCGKEVAVAPPAGGDGSMDVYRRHRNRDGGTCGASRTEVDVRDYVKGDDHITKRSPI